MHDFAAGPEANYSELPQLDPMAANSFVSHLYSAVSDVWIKACHRPVSATRPWSVREGCYLQTGDLSARCTPLFLRHYTSGLDELWADSVRRQTVACRSVRPEVRSSTRASVP